MRLVPLEKGLDARNTHILGSRHRSRSQLPRPTGYGRVRRDRHPRSRSPRCRPRSSRTSISLGLEADTIPGLGADTSLGPDNCLGREPDSCLGPAHLLLLSRIILSLF